MKKYSLSLITIVFMISFFVCLSKSLAQTLITGLSQQIITIDSNFTGAEITLFGTVKKSSQFNQEKKPDIIIIVKGPLIAFQIGQKKNIAGLWIDSNIKKIDKAPAYYAVLANKNIKEITDQKTLDQYEIGIQKSRINFAQDNEKQNTHLAKNPTQAYKQAFIRLLTKKGQYYSNHESIDIIDDTLFFTSLQLPNNAYEGEYLIQTYLFMEGKLIHSIAEQLILQKSSVQRFFFALSKKQPLIYGLLSLLISLLVGLFMGLLFSRKKY